jgi:hypothetical protein
MTDDRRDGSFDELAKGLASGELSRGRALRLMGVALVGGALASLPGIASAAPRQRPDGRKCKTNSQCQSGNCQGGVCQAAPTPTGVNIWCVCRDASGTYSYPTQCYKDNLQCPDPNTTYLEDQCASICGGAEYRVNWGCNTSDFCYT